MQIRVTKNLVATKAALLDYVGEFEAKGLRQKPLPLAVELSKKLGPTYRTA